MNIHQIFPHSISASAWDNVWAVGEFSSTGFAIRWDGGRWSEVEIPADLTNLPQELHSVAALAPDDVWVVGYAQDGDQARTLILHWDGTQWEQVDSPNPGAGNNLLYDITAVSPTDMWAVGGYEVGESDYEPLTLHWDGTQWSTVDGPMSGEDGMLVAVDAASTNNVWAAGAHYNDDGDEQILTMRWDGTEWSQFSSPYPDGYSVDPRSIAAVSPNEAWLAGSYWKVIGDGPKLRPMMLRWNGTAWAFETTPNISDSHTGLYAVDAVAPGEAWAVGHYGNKTLTLRYSTPCVLATSTATATTPATSTATRTSTPVTSSTATSVVTTMATSTGTVPAATSTATRVPATATPQGGAGECQLQFPDVPEGSAFYGFVRCLACRGILGGYSDGTFGPGNLITRGQIAKIVSNAAGFTDAPTTQLFQDVTPDSPFYAHIYRLSMPGRVFMSGYPCGGNGEPCGPQNLPYFRPGANATRGQLSKIVSNAAGFNETPAWQSFEDVATNSAFYSFIERLSSRGYISGYACGAAGEACGGGNLPYFRPNSSVTRGQAAKIVANTFFPNCNTN
jgi:hypothetical protein